MEQNHLPSHSRGEKNFTRHSEDTIKIAEVKMVETMATDFPGHVRFPNWTSGNRKPHSIELMLTFATLPVYSSGILDFRA